MLVAPVRKLLTLNLSSYLLWQLSFFVSNMLHCSSCTIGRKSLNHFCINILLGKCRDTVHCEEVTAQTKGGYGFIPCRLFPVPQTLLVQSEWRSFPLPLVPVDCFSHTCSFRPSFLSLNFCVERNPWDNELFRSCEYLYMKSSSLVLDKTASASTDWVTERGGKQTFSLSWQVYCHASKNGLGSRPLAWKPEKSKLTIQSFWLWSSSKPGHCFIGGQWGGAASSCRLQAGCMAETDFCARQLVRVLQKAINPSVRKRFFRC